jgi:hypothetical protein
MRSRLRRLTALSRPSPQRTLRPRNPILPSVVVAATTHSGSQKGHAIWPSPAEGVVVITSAQLVYMLEGIDWKYPQRTWRPEAVGSSCGILTHLTDSEVTNHAICAPLATVTPPIDNLPDDLESLKRLLAVERAARVDVEAKAVSVEAVAARVAADVSSAEALIARLKLAIEKMRRDLYSSRSERGRKLLDQMEFELEDLEAAAAEDAIAAEMAAAKAGGAATLVPATAPRFWSRSLI